MTRQQRRFEKRKGKREVGFTPVPRTRTRLSHILKAAIKPQYFEPIDGYGYRTYHPTKGWRFVSKKRSGFNPASVS